MYNEKYISAGLDIGSVQAKMIVRLTDGHKLEYPPGLPLHLLSTQSGDTIYGMSESVFGEPLKVTERMLKMLLEFKPGAAVQLQLTGIHAKLIAEALNVPYINEFKAIARGVVEWVPETKTILELGGDGSRFIHIQHDLSNRQVSILDYGRNGDCAAGTGSFIDQQAGRLRFAVENIGELVMTAKNTANIAGRCSVFAKTDMVHAQQRGYSPAAIFKGLCHAVVRNYKATVLRGKILHPPVVFVGGVAANLGVVKAMEEILGLEAGQLIVPDHHLYAAALGCACLPNGDPLSGMVLDRLKILQTTNKVYATRSQKLETSLVQFVTSDIKKKSSDQKVLETYMGIDVGSVSTNLVLLDGAGNVVDEIYTRTDGRPVEVVQRELRRWQEKYADRIHVLGVGTTGSGREMIGELVGADTVTDEITAHKTGAGHIAQQIKGDPVDTIFEIGGQDSKYISIQDGVVVDFTMNEACAAGTGSFLEEQASKMGISIVNEFSELAFQSQTPVQMGERCTVFMEKDVSAYLQKGIARKDITAGLAFAVVQNYLNRVVRGRKIGSIIYFQGGTAYNHSVAAAFAATLGKRIIVPPHCGVMGAIGVALLAKSKIESNPKSSRFHGFDLDRVQFKVRHFTCKGCSNQCDMQEVTVNGEKTYWGDKCSERYRKKRSGGRRATIPNLIDFYQKRLEETLPGPDGLGIKIGIPRTMTHYDRYPFWRTYFSQLGAEICLSKPTNRLTVSKGREVCITEPCFPIIASYGHVVELLQGDVDYVFVPNLINAETNLPEKESWYCPWGQTLPLVIKNTLYESPWCDRLLTPVVRFRDDQEKVAKALWTVAEKMGVRKKRHRHALRMAFEAQRAFNHIIKEAGKRALDTLSEKKLQAVVILGRPYNVYDPGLNLNVPRKLQQHYGINVIPLEFLPIDDI
ncbi:hypothetical protein JXO59_04575, partial [candidate division KSB1 bacterium]|nr:hypothetical protein [candidate division KSB1 bacterium]